MVVSGSVGGRGDKWVKHRRFFYRNENILYDIIMVDTYRHIFVEYTRVSPDINYELWMVIH